ncbi:MAG: hypothetical protein IT462_17425 [Planctomycetes bacterium]|nr:hypothetical protein [Planctomycetota bacterium]
MKPFLNLPALFLLVALFGSALSAARVGDTAQDFKFDKTWNTNATRLSDIMSRGKLIILEQFATW